MVGLRVTDRILGLASTVVLARLLVPADFGLIALAAMIVGMVEMFGDLGMELALIRDQEAGRNHYDTVWTLTIFKGLLVGLMLVVLAVPAADFFGDPRLETIVYVLAFAGAMQGFSNVGIINFNKNLQFGKVFLFHTVSRLAKLVVTVVLAYLWRSYWALVAGILLGQFLTMIFSYILHPYRPRLCLAEWRSIMSFSKWILIARLFGFFDKNADKILLGKLGNTASVGLFSIAYEISNLASSELIAPIKKASFPALAKLAANRDNLKKTYLELVSVMVLFSLPLAAGIQLTSDLLVNVLLGSKWLAVIPLIGVLAIYGLIETCRSQTRPLFMAINRPEIAAYMTMVKAICFVPLFALGMIYYDLYGAAWACVITGVVVLIVDFFLVRRIVGIGIGHVLVRLWRPGLSVAVMYLVVLSYRTSVSAPHRLLDYILELGICAVVGGITYFGSVLLLWLLTGRPEGAERIVLSLIFEWWNRLMPTMKGAFSKIGWITVGKQL